jgi:hypothetical protein
LSFFELPANGTEGIVEIPPAVNPRVLEFPTSGSSQLNNLFDFFKTYAIIPQEQKKGSPPAKGQYPAKRGEGVQKKKTSPHFVLLNFELGFCLRFSA